LNIQAATQQKIHDIHVRSDRDAGGKDEIYGEAVPLRREHPSTGSTRRMMEKTPFVGIKMQIIDDRFRSQKPHL